MKLQKQRLVCLVLAAAMVLSSLAGFAFEAAAEAPMPPTMSTAFRHVEPPAQEVLDLPNIEANDNFRLYHGQIDGRNTLRLVVLNQNPDITGDNAIRVITPGPAEGWPTNTHGHLYIEGLPPNTRWRITGYEIFIDVDENGELFEAQTGGGNLRDIWAETVMYVRLVGPPTYTTADFGPALQVHPRIQFLPEDIPAINARRLIPDDVGVGANMGFATVNNSINEMAAWDGELEEVMQNNTAILDAIEANALKFALGDGYQYGERAIYLAIRFGEAYLASNPTNNRQFNRAVRSFSMAYSWAYNHPIMYNDQVLDIAPEGARTTLLNVIIGILNRTQNDSGFLYPRMSPVTGHGTEEGILYTQLMAGIAVYNEFPELLEFVYNRIMEDFVPVRNWKYRAGSNGQGSGYAPNRFQFDMFALTLLRPFGIEPFNHYMPELLRQTQIYWRLPNGRTIVSGDCFWFYSKDWTSYWNLGTYEFWIGAALFDCGILQWEAHPDRSWIADDDHHAIRQLILRDHTIEMKSPRDIDLPLTRFWDGPFPSMVARTAWVDSPGMNTESANYDAIVVEMRMPRYYSANHQMLDVGSFQIYYKGWLAITAGDYQSGYWDGWGFPNQHGPGHDFNFNKRTVSHNLVTVVDPFEEFPAWTTYWQSNDGGQRAVGRLREPTSFENWMNPMDPTDSYQMSNILGAHYGGGSNPTVAPAFSFIAGDLNYAYSDKINRYQRSMVFLNLGNSGDVPGAFLVFDTLGIRDETYETTWRLHSVDEPREVAAPEGVEIRSIIDKAPFGNDYVTVEYRGRLVNDTLLPAGAELAIIGGEGYHHWIRHFTQSAQDMAAANPDARFSHLVHGYSETHGPGYNFLPANWLTNWGDYPDIRHPGPQKIEDTGGWRIEVSPGSYSYNHEFLNVIQIMDQSNEGAEMVPVLLAAEGNAANFMVGANIENWDVWFSRSTNPITEGFTVYTSANASDLLITGVGAGTWYWYHHGNGVYEFARTNFEGATRYTIAPVEFATNLYHDGVNYAKDQFVMQAMTFYVIHLSGVTAHDVDYVPVEPYVADDVVDYVIFIADSAIYVLNGIERAAVGVVFIDSATDRMMIPLYNVSTALGFDVRWCEETDTAYIYKYDDVLVINIDEQLPLGSLMIVSDHVFVPLRFVVYEFGLVPAWNAGDRTATIVW